MYGWFAVVPLLHAGGTLADAASSATIKAAIVSGLALVIAAGAPRLFAAREREPRVVRELRLSQNARITELTRQRDQALDQARLSRVTVARLHDRVDTLERLCWRHGIDPDQSDPDGRRIPT